CGTPFTAPSGKVYNTAAYSNANLTNLCWTTTNLQEAGYSATCYSNNCGSYPTRGYYYTPGANSDNACAALNSGGHTWRVPTTAEWVALQTAFPSLAAGVGTTGNTATLQADWNSAAILGGGFYYTTTWRYFNEMNHYYAQGPSSACYYFTVGSTTVNRDTRTDYWISVRCVRSL
ncbi:MAG: hypothetical protein LBN93_11570, partial [Candidatus Symbiothrix sp.]|nr:hypothetical protein [Candidatus Symbiothrix sp.]